MVYRMFPKATIESDFSEENIPLKMLFSTDNAPGNPRALMELYNGNKVVFLPSKMPSIFTVYEKCCQHMNVVEKYIS